MTAAEYRRMPERELIGRKARTTREISNAHFTVENDTVVTITGKFCGLSIETRPCTTCGVRVHIRKVQPWCVDLLPV